MHVHQVIALHQSRQRSDVQGRVRSRVRNPQHRDSRRSQPLLDGAVQDAQHGNRDFKAAVAQARCHFAHQHLRARKRERVDDVQNLCRAFSSHAILLSSEAAR